MASECSDEFELLDAEEAQRLYELYKVRSAASLLSSLASGGSYSVHNNKKPLFGGHYGITFMSLKQQSIMIAALILRCERWNSCAHCTIGLDN